MQSGSTSVIELFFSLAPWILQEEDERGAWNQVARHHAGRTLFRFPLRPLTGGVDAGIRMFDDMFSFTFVRHPFVRLVSAYQDKVREGGKAMSRLLNFDS